MILYIHIPFCAKRCGYCSFSTIINKQSSYSDYKKALILDLKNELKDIKKLDSVYIGGGTPNILDSSFYKEIFEIFMPLNPMEVSIESNVNLLDSSWCDDLASMGANRLSIGIQSFNEKKLEFLEREHSLKDIKNAFKKIKAFKNINIDLMFNTPLDSSQLIKEEIESSKNLGINHISAYELNIEPESKFYARGVKDCNIESSLSSEEAINLARENLKKVGFFQYEVSNYALDSSYICKHNLAYWRGEEYIGAGLSAVGRIKNIRYTKQKTLKKYLLNPLDSSLEVLSKENLNLENLFLGLRSMLGVSTSNLDSRKVDLLIKENKAFVKNNKLYANDFFLADEIAIFLS